MAEYVGIKNILSQFWAKEKASVAAQGVATLGDNTTTIQGAINTLKANIDALKSFEYAISETIPEAVESNTGKIFLVPKGDDLVGYREYLVVKQSDSTYRAEEIGDTDIDLSGKQDKLTEEQLAAVNSGITAEGLATINKNIDALAIAVNDKVNATDVSSAVNTALTLSDDEFNAIFTA